MAKDSNFQTIQSLGRDKLINELCADASVEREEVVQGIGDDAAVIRSEENVLTLLSSETFVEGVDFDLTYTPLHHLGYKVISNAVSDIYAMNGQPMLALVNLAVPNKLSVDMLKQIYKGIHVACKDYNVQLAGGDLTASHQTLSIGLSCTGQVKEDCITYRSGANEGDTICITGDLCGAIAGLRVLMREKKYWEQEENEQTAFQPNLEKYEYVVKRQLLPLAQKDVVEMFHEQHVIPHAMIDLTQGLISELKSISEASGVGAQIYQAALPVAVETRKVADEMQEEVDKYVMYGGEDLELMFTIEESSVDELKEVFSNFNVIGKIGSAQESVTMKTAEGDLVEFKRND